MKDAPINLPPDRGDAVNLARNVLEDPALAITPKGVRILAEAVMKLDAAILADRAAASAEPQCVKLLRDLRMWDMWPEIADANYWLDRIDGAIAGAAPSPAEPCSECGRGCGCHKPSCSYWTGSAPAEPDQPVAEVIIGGNGHIGILPLSELEHEQPLYARPRIKELMAQERQRKSAEPPAATVQQEPVAWQDVQQPWDLYRTKPQGIDVRPLYATRAADAAPVQQERAERAELEQMTISRDYWQSSVKEVCSDLAKTKAERDSLRAPLQEALVKLEAAPKIRASSRFAENLISRIRAVLKGAP